MQVHYSHGRFRGRPNGNAIVRLDVINKLSEGFEVISYGERPVHGTQQLNGLEQATCVSVSLLGGTGTSNQAEVRSDTFYGRSNREPMEPARIGLQPAKGVFQNALVFLGQPLGKRAVVGEATAQLAEVVDCRDSDTKKFAAEDGD